MKRFAFVITLMAALGLLFCGESRALTIDGSLGDIGVTPGSDWVANAGVISASEPDAPDGSGLNYYLGPGYGGQRYDAEGLYCLRLPGQLYVAIVTGTKLSNPAQYVSPGDLAISRDGGASWGIGVELTGKTYTIDSHGYTVGSAADKQLGRVYDDATWLSGLPNWGGVSDPTQLADGVVGDAVSLAYAETGTHAVWEMLIPTSVTGCEPLKLHWTSGCGNDALDLDVAPVPEPATLLLVGAGLLGVAGVRRRR